MGNILYVICCDDNTLLDLPWYLWVTRFQMTSYISWDNGILTLFAYNNFIFWKMLKRPMEFGHCTLLHALSLVLTLTIHA
jgi:hypothetical protein